MIKNIDTITTGAISLTALEFAPKVAEITNVPANETITLIMQIIMSLATLYKLFFYKPKKKETDNV
jgi:hypothetical protein